jgi:hypothetical protein
METFQVDVPALHLRSRPVVAPSSKLALLHHGQTVEKIEVVPNSDWWRVAAAINGVAVTGYVNSTYLKSTGVLDNHPAYAEIGPVHLFTNRLIARSSANGRAFPLNEQGRPKRASGGSIEKVNELFEIIDWLAVDKNLRYRPAGSSTYCNIYAYDYCYLANAYLPRVWWTSKAILTITSGKVLQPIYGETVSELNANSLHDWLADYGVKFGWQRTFDLTELQANANDGGVCIVAGKRKDINRPGHICAVVPENDGHRANRKNGAVTVPLQSSAGASNFRYGGSIWWTSDKFSSFSFWIHP